MSDISINLSDAFMGTFGLLEFVLCAIMIFSEYVGSKLGFYITMPLLLILVVFQIAMAVHL